MASLPVISRKWKQSVRQASRLVTKYFYFKVQVGLIYIGTIQVPENPTFKSSHVSGTLFPHAYGTHGMLLNQL